MDSAPLVDHDDRGWFASTHRAHLNQKARLRWEDGAKPKVLYLSWRDLSLVCSDHVSTIHTCESVFLFPPPGFIPDFATALTHPIRVCACSRKVRNVPGTRKGCHYM